jgi:hypothetical protein
MKNEPLFKYITIAILTGVVIAFTSAARAEDGKEITRTGTYTTSNGGSGKTSSVTTRSQGTVTRNGTWTNAAGGVGTRQSQAVWNKSTQTATVSGSVTRPNGATTSWQGTAVRTAPGSFSENGTITRANGKQATYSGTDTRVAPGSWDRSTVITNANGTKTNRTVDTTVSGGNGTRVTTTTLPDGKTVTRDGSFTQTVSAIPPPNP